MATDNTIVACTAVSPADVWKSVLEEFEATQRAYEVVSEAQDAADRLVEATSPLPDVLKRKAGGAFTSENAILTDGFLSFDKKVELVNAVRAWSPHRDAAMAEHRVEEHQDAFDAALGVMDDALDLMAITPAPDMEALLLKVRTLIARRLVGYKGEHADDPTFASRLLTDPHHSAETVVLHIYRDLLRLMGRTSPILEAVRFDARAWIVEFERQPDCEVSTYGVGYYDETGRRPRDLSSWSALPKWQQHIVREAAKEREEALSEAGAAGRGFYAPDFLEVVRDAGGEVRVEDGNILLEEGLEADLYRLTPIRRHLRDSSRARQSIIAELSKRSGVTGTGLAAAE